ncbi:MAG: hypothetical protein ABJC89_25385, partial [Acidobacteriota bacterium]
MRAEWRRIVRLGRTFFGRLFESELMPPGVPQVELVIGSIVLLGAPGFFLSFVRIAYGMPLLAIASDRLILFTFAMITMGFVGLATWDGVFPDRRDARVLGPLPIRTSTLVLARLGALGSLFGLFIAGTQAVPAVLFEGVATYVGGPGWMPRAMLAHFIATVLASAFVFFGLIALQCGLLLVLPRSAAQRVAVALQTLLATGLLLMLLVLPHLRGRIDTDAGAAWMSSRLARLLPSVWFIRLYEMLCGVAGAGGSGAGAGALILTLSITAAAILLYGASYHRLTRHAIETPPGAPARVPMAWPRELASLVPAWLRGSQITRAVCVFTLRTLVRSRQHRMLLALYFAVALALIVTGALPMALGHDALTLAHPRVAIMSAPLVLLFFMLIGIWTLFAMPVELGANWVFRLREPVDRRAVVRGVARAMLAGCVVPVALSAAVISGWLWGARVGILHGVFCGLMGLALVEVLLIHFCKVPFTCTYFPGTARLRVLWPAYLAAFTNYAYTAASLETDILLTHPLAYGVFCGILAFAIAALAVTRARALARRTGLLFEEPDPDALFA